MYMGKCQPADGRWFFPGLCPVFYSHKAGLRRISESSLRTRQDVIYLNKTKGNTGPMHMYILLQYSNWLICTIQIWAPTYLYNYSLYKKVGDCEHYWFFSRFWFEWRGYRWDHIAVNCYPDVTSFAALVPVAELTSPWVVIVCYLQVIMISFMLPGNSVKDLFVDYRLINPRHAWRTEGFIGYV